MISLRVIVGLALVAAASPAHGMTDAGLVNDGYDHPAASLSNYEPAPDAPAGWQPEGQEITEDLVVDDSLEQPEKADDPAEGMSIGSDQAFELDCAHVSKATGWSLKATRQHMKGQALFSGLVAFVQRRYLNVFAGSAYARGPGQASTLWFKGSVPDRVTEAAARFQQESQVKVNLLGGMRYSLNDQDKRMRHLQSMLRNRGFNHPGGAVRPGDVILVTLPANQEFPASPKPASTDDGFFQQAGEMNPDLADRLFPGFDTYGVIVSFVEGDIEGDEHAYGGRWIYGDDTDGDGLVASCTSAFSVYRVSDNKNGICSAAHCTGIVNFDAVSPESDFDLYHKGEHRGSYGDLEWKTSDHYEIAEYYAEPGSSRRDVTSVWNSFSVNDWVCVYSRVQGERNCEQVYSVNVSQGGDDKLIAVDNHVTTGGDSGGPWSWSTEAAGIHKGYKTIWFKARSTFSKAKLLNSALGVKVLLK
jgi:hypothetical protein